MMNEKELTVKSSISFDSATSKFVGTLNGKIVVRSKYESAVVAKLAEMSGSVAEAEQVVAAKNEKYDINTRFSFVEKLVTMVATGVQPSAVITGEGGLGKTYTVTKTLKAHGLQDISDLADFQVGTVLNARKCFVFVKGYSTAKGLYRTLFENQKGTIVFDDCDAVLKDPVALMLLKGALDSYGKRVISWNADMKDDDLPRSFEFSGRVIFISNMAQDKIDQAIRSRSMMIDLSMTLNQKIDRMEHIAMSDEFLPEYDMSVKKDALNLIREIKDECKEISLRTLISVAKIRASNKDWKDLAAYMLTA
jgi:ethanolamine utilization cobalamin adenosyltransferase